MRKPSAGIKRTAAFVVDEHERELVGAAFDSETEHEATKQFRFSRPRRSADESVRTVAAQIETQWAGVGNADRCYRCRINATVTPPRLDDIGKFLRLVGRAELEERANAAGFRESRARVVDVRIAQTGQARCDAQCCLRRHTRNEDVGDRGPGGGDIELRQAGRCLDIRKRRAARHDRRAVRRERVDRRCQHDSRNRQRPITEHTTQLHRALQFLDGIDHDHRRRFHRRTGRRCGRRSRWCVPRDPVRPPSRRCCLERACELDHRFRADSDTTSRGSVATTACVETCGSEVRQPLHPLPLRKRRVIERERQWSVGRSVQRRKLDHERTRHTGDELARTGDAEQRSPPEVNTDRKADDAFVSLEDVAHCRGRRGRQLGHRRNPPA